MDFLLLFESSGDVLTAFEGFLLEGFLFLGEFGHLVFYVVVYGLGFLGDGFLEEDFHVFPVE